ncbi:D-alanyl-D-alanine carboxypeptidase [Streptomyces sp. LP05-1]|uniref:D-alanyl-D-alanine carboxypeptidase n=1 Tax=Streptomyces pyxinae TaxID=2970734 RepID=A0ABT2CCD4_9ACTN|nr:serine hydrolase [Streptomyces sp. LP05-1]MCS0635080.1 D-alanyl-D-alanine carboxypeptidase [Streptomyces sp. LP05-1]
MSVTSLAAACVLLLSPAVAVPATTAPVPAVRVAAAAPRTGAPAPGAGEPVPPPATASADPSLLRRPGVQTRPATGVAAPPPLSARSWLVADARTGAVLAARDAHERLPPASTLKALFALTVLPRLDSGARHTVADTELAEIGDGSSLVGVKENLTYRVSDLWNGVFLSSGNDAVHVLAGMNGGWEETTRQMQRTAESLGARDTRVVSPDGYDAPGQVSSAYDLAVFGREGLKNPDFVRYAGTADAQFPADGWSFGIKNTNRLVTGADGVARYPGILGLKNGYTSGAGHTLIAAARKGPHTLVVTVMNPQDGGAYTVYEEARALLDWGFTAVGRTQPVGSLTTAPATLPAAATPVAAGPAAAPPGHPVAEAAEKKGPGLALPLVFLASAALAALFLWRRLRRRRPKPAADFDW